MARDMQIDMEINPIFDTKAFDEGLKKLANMAQRGVSGLSSTKSASFEALAARLMASLQVTGRATSATQARMQVESALGTKLSGETRAVLRGAQNISQIAVNQGRVAKYQSFTEKQLGRMQPQYASIATAYNEALAKFLTVKDKPTAADKESLIKNLMEIANAVKAIGKNQPKALKTIEKDTKLMSKEVSGWRVSTQAGATGIGAFMGAAKQLIGLLVSAMSFQKIVSMAKQGLATGESDIANQMIYGEKLDIGSARALAKFYNLPEESLLKIQQSALTWHTRMINNRLTAEEWYGAARTGDFGRALVSGAGAQNPTALYASLMNYMYKNRGNEAEVMLNLQRLGLDPNLMKMMSQAYPLEDYLRDVENYRESITKQKVAATTSRRGRSWFKKQETAANAAAANLAFGWWNNDAARYLQSLSPAEREIFYQNATNSNRVVMERGTYSWGNELLKETFSPLRELFTPLSAMAMAPTYANSMGKEISVVVNNQNTMNITGGDAKETAEEIREQMENWTMLGLNNYIKQRRK